MARPRSSVSFARPGSLIPSLGRLAGRYYLCDNNYGLSHSSSRQDAGATGLCADALPLPHPGKE
jgi:hypothetical protein